VLTRVDRGIAALLMAMLASCGHGGGAVGGPDPSLNWMEKGKPDRLQFSVTVRLPVPPTLPPLPPIEVKQGEQPRWQGELCAADRQTVRREDWAAALAEAGYEVQINDWGGWIGTADITVRFRDKRVFGDLYSNMDLYGCRTYILRFQLVPPTPRTLAWATHYGDFTGDFVRGGRCIDFFRTNHRFPFDHDEYTHGRCDLKSWPPP